MNKEKKKKKIIMIKNLNKLIIKDKQIYYLNSKQRYSVINAIKLYRFLNTNNISNFMLLTEHKKRNQINLNLNQKKWML